MKLIPLHDWAVIVPSEAAAMTAGGLYIPDTAQQKPEEGVVEAIGPGAYEEEKREKKKEENKERKFVPTVVKPGDRVLYERWAGQTYKIGTEDRILIRERNILGFIEKPLQIPHATSSPAGTAIVARPAGDLAKSEQQDKKTLSTAVKTIEKKPGKTSEKAAGKSSAKPSKTTSKTGKKK